MLRPHTLLLAILAACRVGAEPPPLVDWAFTDGTPFPDSCHSLQLDASGSLYLGGSFGKEAKLVPSSINSAYLRQLRDGVVTKLSPERKTLWQFKTGGQGSASFTQLFVDRERHVTALGSFWQEVEVGASNFQTTNTNGGTFVVRLSSAGKLAWVNRLTLFANGKAMAVTPSGDIYLAGVHPPELQTDEPKRANTNAWTSLVKLDSAGKTVWEKPFAEGHNTVQRLVTDAQENLYLTMLVHKRTTLAEGTALAADGPAMCVLKVDREGKLLWVFAVSYAPNSTESQSISGLAVGAKQDVFFAGAAASGADIGGRRFISKGKADIFIGKLNSSGQLQWLAQAGGSSHDNLTSLALDADENVYVAGGFQEKSQFGNTTLNAQKANDVFVSKMDSAGRFVWTQSYGSDGYDLATALAADGTRGLYVGGWYQQPMTLGEFTLRPNHILPEQIMTPVPKQRPDLQQRSREQALKQMFNADGKPTARAYSTDIFTLHLLFQTNAASNPTGVKPKP